MAVAELHLKEKPRLEQWLGPENYRIIRALARNPLSVTGMFLISVFVFIALFAPVLAPTGKNDPYRIPRDGFNEIPREPGSEWKVRAPEIPFWWTAVTGKEKWVHIMGTAAGQWDIYYGIIWGTQTALIVGIVITITTLVIGVFVGATSAYYGGFIDDFLMRITEIFMAFPFLLAALTLSAVLGAGQLAQYFGKNGLIKDLGPSMIALITFGWMTYARLIRGDIMATKERDYVLAARTIGVRDNSILLRHIIPNAVYPTLVVASLDIGSYVLSFAALSFLGVGTEVGYADWGQIIAFARPWISQLGSYWFIVLYPGLALVFFGLAWNLVGDALRDVMDPRMKGRGA